jgi:hypothetical protein
MKADEFDKKFDEGKEGGNNIGPSIPAVNDGPSAFYKTNR